MKKRCDEITKLSAKDRRILFDSINNLSKEKLLEIIQNTIDMDNQKRNDETSRNSKFYDYYSYQNSQLLALENMKKELNEDIYDMEEREKEKRNKAALYKSNKIYTNEPPKTLGGHGIRLEEESIKNENKKHEKILSDRSEVKYNDEEFERN